MSDENGNKEEENEKWEREIPISNFLLCVDDEYGKGCGAKSNLGSSHCQGCKKTLLGYK